jgi:hypothetical protein
VRGVRDERRVARSQDDGERVGPRELSEHRDPRRPEFALALDGQS